MQQPISIHFGGQQPAKGPQFSIRNVPQMLAWQPPQIDPIISHGILYPKTRMIIYGRWKSWKSMFAQDLGFAIASGGSWLGFKTAGHPLTVLNLQLEIPEFLLKKRIEKYANSHSNFPTTLHYWTQHYLKLDRDYGIGFLEQVLGRIHPDVLIIDPIYKVITGNISDSSDISKFLDYVDNLMEKWNFAVILVHHERKPGTDSDGNSTPHTAADMMGSSYFLNWCDTGVMLERIGDENSNIIQVNFDPVRHAEEDLPRLRLTFDRMTLGARIMFGDVRPGFTPP